MKDGEVVDVVLEYIIKVVDNENKVDEESITLGDGLEDKDYDKNWNWGKCRKASRSRWH